MQTIKSKSIAAGKPDTRVKVRATRRQGNAIATTESAVDGEPTHEQIAMLAAQIYIDGGSRSGCDLENWLKAEQILRKKRATWQASSTSVGATRQAEDGGEQSLGQHL